MVEPWNKVNIPYPSAVSSCQITFNDNTAKVIKCLVVQCENVLKLLCSEVLRTEISVLYELLYVVNNGLRKHKPFRAIKQVEQCINRLNEMKLQTVLQDLQELCPNQTQSDAGIEIGHCRVPSQPMLEWVCLKLLGASKLVARTLDQCSKAFILTRQHLHLSEFILLNLVLAGMLSRLWVFFRGILRALGPLYQRILELRLDVAHCQPMPYLTDLPLPEDLESFLGPTHCGLLQEGSRTEPSSKTSLFEEGEKEHLEECSITHMLTSEGMEASMDLGTTILQRRRYHSQLDIKSVLQRIQGPAQQHAVEVTIKTEKSGVSKSAVARQKRMFLKRLKMASSFSSVSVLLEEVIGWCRRCKLRQERRHLAFLLLRCQRLKALECEGIRVQKKLRTFCLCVRRVMFKAASRPRSSSSSVLWRTQSLLRTRFTIMARYRSVRNRFRRVRTRSLIPKDLFGATVNLSPKSKMHMNVSPLHAQLLKKGQSGSDVLLNHKENQRENSKPSVVCNDEIDDIFSSLEF